MDLPIDVGHILNRGHHLINPLLPYLECLVNNISILILSFVLSKIGEVVGDLGSDILQFEPSIPFTIPQHKFTMLIMKTSNVIMMREFIVDNEPGSVSRFIDTRFNLTVRR